MRATAAGSRSTATAALEQSRRSSYQYVHIHKPYADAARDADSGAWFGAGIGMDAARPTSTST